MNTILKYILNGVFTSFIVTIAYAQSARIQLTVEDIQDSVAYLGYHFADKRFVLDTVIVDGPEIEFAKDKPYKTGLYFFYTPNVYFEFIVNEPEIIIETIGPNYLQNLKVIKSEENKVFQEMQQYVSGNRKTYKELSALAEELKDDSIGLDDLRKKLKHIDKDVSEYQKKIALDHPDMFVSKMMLTMQKPQIPDSLKGISRDLEIKRYLYYKNHFFDGIDIADAGLLRTPLLHQKIIEYLDKVIVQVPDSVINEVDMLLEKAKRNEESFRYLLVSLSNKYETSPIMGQDKVFVHIIEKYYLTGTATWVDDELIKKLSERIETIKPNFIGNQAPPLILTDTTFSRFSLYDLKSDYVVLYFYDPDCGHCKKMSPILYEAYGRMSLNNIEVLAINITTNYDRWKEYIYENEFDWVNLVDSNGKSNFRYYYDVRSTPTIYILDKNKKIIAKKIEASQVEDFINAASEKFSKEKEKTQ